MTGSVPGTLVLEPKTPATNAVAMDGPAKSADDEEDTTPAEDWTVREVENILADYVALTAKGVVAVANPGAELNKKN